METIERLTELFDRHAEADTANFKNLEEKIDMMRENFHMAISDKVSYQHFYWIVGVLMAVVSSTFLYMVYRLDQIDLVTRHTQNDVSFIQGKFVDVDKIIKQ